jgi:hypothetical protein
MSSSVRSRAVFATPRLLSWPLTRGEAVALLFLLALASTWAAVSTPPRGLPERGSETTVIRIDL